MATKIQKFHTLHSLAFTTRKIISLTDFLFKFLLSCSYNVLISDRVVLLWTLVAMETDHNNAKICVFIVEVEFEHRIM